MAEGDKEQSLEEIIETRIKPDLLRLCDEVRIEILIADYEAAHGPYKRFQWR